MLTRDTNAQAEHFASTDELRVGLYVFIDLPWFRHPFTLNSFRISSEDQLRDLRALKKPRFRYDPARSAGPDAPPDVTKGLDSPETAASADTVTPASAEVPDVNQRPDPPARAADARVLQVNAYRKAAARTEKSFIKAVGLVRRMDRNIQARPRETLDEMGALVDQMTTVFLERDEVTLQVMGENCGGEDVYHHGLNVSILCMMLIKGLEFGREQAGLLGTGALLHDIGLAEVPGRILMKSPDEQSRPERDLRARHIEYGATIGGRLNLAPEIMAIIEQHHEFADGSGYPLGLRLEQIAPLARIVSLVNYYDNLCNPVDFFQAMTPHEALSFIFARQNDRFDSHVLQVMIRSLGVYPPGSFVGLSNDATAMVVSVNPHKSMRPWVMLYDAAVPREKATLLNLEAESDISISKSIRPALLPAPVHAYLSPRKRITYFFDGQPSNAGERK